MSYHLVRVGEMRWDDLSEFSEGLAGASNDGQWGFIDTTGKLVISLQSDWKYAFPFSEGLAQVDVGSANFDFIDKTGRGLIRSQFEHPDENTPWARQLMTSSDRQLRFSYGLIPVQNKQGKLGFMNRKGRLVVPCQWDQVFEFHEGVASIETFNGTTGIARAGFIDVAGNIVVPLQWEVTVSFSGGLAMVSAGGRCGFINKAGQVVIPLEWETCESFRRGFALVLKNRKYGIINQEGKAIVEPKLSGFMLSDPVIVFLEHKNGILDPSGHVAGDRWWDSIHPAPQPKRTTGDSAENLVPPPNDYTLKIEKDKKWGLVNFDGSILVPPIWDDIGYLKDGIIPVRESDKWGLIDHTGKILIKPRWDAIMPLDSASTNLIAMNSGKWGIFDRRGATVIKPQWHQVSSFSEGFAAVRLDNKWGLIDQSGQEIEPVKWDWIEPPHNNMVRVREGKNWMLMRMETR